MEPTGPTYQSPATRTWVLRHGADTDGELFEQRVEYAPGSPFPPLHHHPAQSELFEVEQGAMIYVVEGQEQRVIAGERLEVPPGTPHKARNASDSELAIIRWETRPALRSEAFFTAAAVLGEADPLDRALLAHEYRDVFKADGLLGAAIPLLAAVARLLGRHLPEVNAK